MAEFEVTVRTERTKETYRIHDEHHDNKCVNVAGKALRSFEAHGHAKFPHEDGPLTVEVKPVNEKETP